MKHVLSTIALLSVLPLFLQPDVAFAQATEGTEGADGTEESARQEDAGGPVRPGDAEGQIAESDGLAECAAILAVASSRSNNLVQRDRMMNGSSGWFAASGDLAQAEGALPEPDLWEAKVSSWAGRIGSVDGMAQHADWMGYCVAIGQQRGLDTEHFAAHLD